MDAKTLKYSKTHEWLQQSGDTATIGISDFAVQALTDLVYIDLPQKGRKLKAGEVFGEVESVKAVSDLYSPVGGEVLEVNTKLPDNLHLLAEDPFGAGWLIKVKVTTPPPDGQMLDHADYVVHCESQAH